MRYSVPWLNLDPEAARRMIDREGVLGPVEGQRVLCLAAGGGQQTAAFGLLGSVVTILDGLCTIAQWQGRGQAGAYRALRDAVREPSIPRCRSGLAA